MNYQYSNPLEDLKRTFRKQSMLTTLILINGGVWIFVKIAVVFFYLFNQADTAAAESIIIHFFGLPANPETLLSVPWTIITYMFFHVDFWHILFNMLWLFWFGKIFLEFMKPRQLLVAYLTGGIAGGILYIIAFNIFPVFRSVLPLSVALGASASVMSIVTATAFYVPNYTIQLIFLGRVKILYMAIVLFIIDFFAIPTGNAGGHLAHIGGAIWGVLFVLMLKRSVPNPFSDYSGDFISKLKKFFNGRRMHVSHNTSYSNRPKTDEEYNIEKKLNQKRIDTILEKISKGGYDSLTKEEKEFLFKSSGKNQ